MEKGIQIKKDKPHLLPMILDKASKVELIRTFGSLTLKEIVQESYPSVGTLAKEHGLEQIEKVMSIILLDLSQSFDGELGKDDAEEICAEVNSSILRNLSLEDIYLICRDIKMTQTYKLTVNRVMKQMNKHFEARCTAAAKYHENEHLSNKFYDRDRKGDYEKNKQLFREAKVWHLNQQAKQLDNKPVKNKQ